MIKMKPLLKESTWTNRKFGESLPTLEDYMSETYDDENCGDGHAVVSEADPTNDDDKYVSVGWGKYKEKGKEDDENAPTFSKTDSGQFVKAGGDEKGGDAPEKEPAGKLGGGDFERDFEDDPDDIDNLDTALDDDPTRGDPDDSWDDEEGRAKPSGGDFTKSADYDMWSDDDEYAISGTDSDDPAGGKGDAWMYGDDDEEAARAQAMKDMEDEFGDMGEITIDGKKYKPITESIKPKIYDPYREIKKQFKRVSLRQFDRRWQK